MKTKTAAVVGGVLVVGIVALWPRGGGHVDEAPPVVSAPGPAVAARAGAAGAEGAAPPAGPSLHARIVAAAREGPPAHQAEIPDHILDSMEPEQAARVRSPLYRMSPEERLEAHRAGMIWPEAPTVKGPPGKPDIATGSTRDEVRAAWGPPVKILPARVEMRNALLEAKTQPETDRLEHNEIWFYDVGDGLSKGFGHFDADGKLTPFTHSRESMAALAAERQALMIKIEKRWEAGRRSE